LLRQPARMSGVADVRPAPARRRLEAAAELLAPGGELADPAQADRTDHESVPQHHHGDEGGQRHRHRDGVVGREAEVAKDRVERHISNFTIFHMIAMPMT
jgi:hypothetical protein